MKVHKNYFNFVFVLIIICFISEVHALGISPGRTTLDYSEGAKQVSFNLVNSEHKDLNLKLYARGELNQSVIISEKDIKLTATEESKTVTFELNLAAGLSPGTHKVEIVAVQQSEQAEGNAASFGTNLGVATQIYINVPYNGAYIEPELKIYGTDAKKNFVIEIINRGNAAVAKSSAVIVIYDNNGKEIKRLNTNEVSLAAGEKKEITAEWDVDQPIGKYSAKAALKYDDKQMLIEKEFEIGESSLDLQRIYVENFKLGDIAKFNIIVKNKWNEAITGAYAEMRVYDDSNNEIGNFKSATYDIPSGMQTTMTNYWDTKDIKVGVYNSNIILNYLDKKTQQDMKLDVRQDSITVIGLGYVISSQQEGSSSSSSGLVKILIIVIVVLVLLNLLWFLVLRKRMKKG